MIIRSVCPGINCKGEVRPAEFVINKLNVYALTKTLSIHLDVAECSIHIFACSRCHTLVITTDKPILGTLAIP